MLGLFDDFYVIFCHNTFSLGEMWGREPFFVVCLTPNSCMHQIDLMQIYYHHRKDDVFIYFQVQVKYLST